MSKLSLRCNNSKASRQMNLVHGSDGPEAAAREIALYFRDDEICANDPTISKWLRASDEA